MDGFSGFPSDDVEGNANESAAPNDVAAAIGTDERRMHVRAYNYWVSLLDGRDFPSIEDLEPHDLTDFSSHSVLVDFTGGIDNPALPYIGAEIREECGLDERTQHIADVPSRSLLSRITDHYMQIIANRAPVGFEAEFVNQRAETICYRGILMPFSSDGDTIDFIYGVINWKKGDSAPITHATIVPALAPLEPELPEDVAAALDLEAPLDEEEEDALLLTDIQTAAPADGSDGLDEDAAEEASDAVESAYDYGEEDEGEDVNESKYGSLLGRFPPASPVVDVEDEADEEPSKAELRGEPRFSQPIFRQTALPDTDDLPEVEIEIELEGFDDEESTLELDDDFFAASAAPLDVTPASDEPLETAHKPIDPAIALMEEEERPLRPAISADEAGLADRLVVARECAEAAKAGEGRTRAALYEALSQAYDFALASFEEPEEFAELLADSGVTAQARAPMTPIVKLVFGIDYDKARLTEFAAALSYASRQSVQRGEFDSFIAAEQGLKALVAAERRARRPDDLREDKGEEARAALRLRPVLGSEELGGDEEFAVVVMRRLADGTVEPVAVLDDSALAERVIRKVG